MATTFSGFSGTLGLGVGVVVVCLTVVACVVVGGAVVVGRRSPDKKVREFLSDIKFWHILKAKDTN